MRILFSLYRISFSNLQRNAWILSLAMFINRSGSMVLLFTSLYLTRELHFTIGQAGIIMSFYGIGSVLGSYAGGWLTDRKNYFDIMVFSLIVSGLILLLMLAVTSITGVAAVIFLYAFTADMFRPANSAAIAAYSTPENRARSVSLVRLAINLGFSVGPAAGGLIALHLGYTWLFVIDAFTGFAAAWMLFVYLPRIAVLKERHNNTILSDSSTSAYRDYRFLLFIILVALYGTCFFQLFASVPQYFSHVCHYNEDTIGLLLALNGLLVVIIEMPLVASLEKKKKNFAFIITGTLCMPIAFAILLLGKEMMIFAVFYTLLITLAEIFAMPFMMNYVLSRPLKERQGQYSALYSISFGLANIAAPLLGLGIAERFGFDSMFIFLIALSLLVAFGFNWLHKKEIPQNLNEYD
ncbi:MAG TPA: MFS transporter [Bacteroidia bacterium]|nr:MFS transporter [Bacteroidia bacterium]